MKSNFGKHCFGNNLSPKIFIFIFLLSHTRWLSWYETETLSFSFNNMLWFIELLSRRPAPNPALILSQLELLLYWKVRRYLCLGSEILPYGEDWYHKPNFSLFGDSLWIAIFFSLAIYMSKVSWHLKDGHFLFSCKDKNRILPQPLWGFLTTCRIVTSVSDMSFLCIKRFVFFKLNIDNFDGI